MTESSSSSGSLPPGAVIGDDFRIVRQLGRGGMGVVYIADQISTGKRRALKVMQRGPSDDGQASVRFEREARVGGLVESEHLVDVIAAGVDLPTGLRWLAMELLEGLDLATYALARGRLSPREVRDVFGPMCAGIGAAHARGIVHRDLKPENVFLARPRSGDPERVAVKVLDFGIAKVLSGDIDTARTTASLGTPLWMAPEQTSVRAIITPATDVWALGLMAFYLLVGRSYWREPSSTMELLREIVVEPLEPASARARALGFEAGVPAGFDAWFARCVVRDPAQRFASATEAWAGLEPLLAGNEGRGLTLPSVAPPAITGEVSPFDPTVGVVGARSTELQPVTPTPTSRSRARLAVLYALPVVALLGAGGWWQARTYRAPSGAATLVPSAATSPRDAITGRMVYLPAVTFDVGNDANRLDAPRHRVGIAAMWMDATEVTVGAYTACVDDGVCSSPFPGAASMTGWRQPGRENLPINSVTWAEARDFCVWAGKRLPTEEEWERAAVGGTAQRAFPWGNGDPGPDVCWQKPATSAPCPVASSPGDRTPEGIFDLAGNVKEWTASRFCPYTEPGCTPDSGIAMRVARGGEYPDRMAAVLRATFRSQFPDYGGHPLIGFRCVR